MQKTVRANFKICCFALYSKCICYNGALMQWYKKGVFFSLSSKQYLAASSLSPTSRLSPCSSSRETLRLGGLTGSGLSSSRVAGNSSANLSRNFLASSSSSPILGLALAVVGGVAGEACGVSAARTGQEVGRSKFHTVAAAAAAAERRMAEIWVVTS